MSLFFNGLTISWNLRTELVIANQSLPMGAETRWNLVSLI